MRRNSALSTSLLTLALVLFGSVQFAQAGGFLSRLLAGKKGTARPICKLRIYQPKNECCPPPITFCPPRSESTDCPKELLLMVSDVDESNEPVCVYRVFLSENCQDHSTFIVTLPCTVNAAVCVNRKCGQNGNEGLEGPFIVINELPPLNPDPTPEPIPTPTPGNPGTNGVVVDTNAQGVSNGLPPVPPGMTRHVIAARALNVDPAGYYQYMDVQGNTKFYALYRFKYLVNGVEMYAGVGHQVDAVPSGGTMLPGRFGNVFNKTNRLDETDPNDPNKVVWTYVVHDQR